MTADDQRFYLLTEKQQAKEREKYDDPADTYDSDLNRTLFQEFWTDLSEFKKKPKIRSSKSVIRGSESHQGPIKIQPNLKFQGRYKSPAMVGLYQSTPKGIAGSLSIDSQAFTIDVKDPMSPLNREINPQFVKPRVKFDSIFDEYIAKQKQFDHLRQG